VAEEAKEKGQILCEVHLSSLCCWEANQSEVCRSLPQNELISTELSEITLEYYFTHPK
jgi:hypothetical protein